MSRTSARHRNRHGRTRSPGLTDTELRKPGRHIRSLRLRPPKSPPRQAPRAHQRDECARAAEAGGHREPSAPTGTPRAGGHGGWRRARSRCALRWEHGCRDRHRTGSRRLATFAIDHVRSVPEFRAGRASRRHPAQRPLVAPTPAQRQAGPPAWPERIEGPVPAEDSSVARDHGGNTVVITASLVREGRAQPAECVVVRCLIRAEC